MRIIIKKDNGRKVLSNAKVVCSPWEIECERDISKLGPDDQISLMSDAMFATMFQSSDRMKYPCKLLSTILDVSYEELLKKCEFYKNVFDSDVYVSKKERGDLILKIGDSIVNIEANMTPTIERNCEYLDRISRSSIVIGGEYKYPKTVIQINLNNYVLEGVEDTVEVYRIQEPRGKMLIYKVLIHVYIPLIRQKEYTCGREGLSELERCVLVMTTNKKKQAELLAKGDVILTDYVMEAEFMRLNDEYIGCAYDRDWAREEFGIRKGQERGRQEMSREIATEMFQKGLDFKTVQECTKLSVYELEMIRASLNKNDLQVADSSRVPETVGSIE